MQYVIYCNKLTEEFVEFHKNPGETMSKCIARLMRERAEEYFKGVAFTEDEP